MRRKRAINAQDFNAAADDLIRTRAATAGPAYQRALAIETPVDVKPIIDDISARLSTAKGDIKATPRRRRGCFGIALASLTPRSRGYTRRNWRSMPCWKNTDKQHQPGCAA